MRYVPEQSEGRPVSFDCAFTLSLAAARADPGLVGAFVARLEGVPVLDGKHLPEDPATARAIAAVSAGLPLPDGHADVYREVSAQSGAPVVEERSSYEVPGPGGPVPIPFAPGEPRPRTVEALVLQTLVVPRLENAHRDTLRLYPAQAARTETSWASRRADVFAERPDLLDALDSYDTVVADDRAALVPRLENAHRDTLRLYPAQAARTETSWASRRADVFAERPDLLDALDSYDTVVADDRAAIARVRPAGPFLPTSSSRSPALLPGDGRAVDDPDRAGRNRTDHRAIGRATSGPSTQRYGPFVTDTSESWEQQADVQRLGDEITNRDLDDSVYDTRLVDPARDSDPHASTVPRSQLEEHRFAVRGRPPEGPDVDERRAAFLERRADEVVASFVAAATGVVYPDTLSAVNRLESQCFGLTGTSPLRPTPWMSAETVDAVLVPARPMEFVSAIAPAWIHGAGNPALLAAALPSALEWRKDDAGVLDPFAAVPGAPSDCDYVLSVPTPSLRFPYRDVHRPSGSPPERCVEHAYVEHVLLPQVERGHQQLCRTDPAEAVRRERSWDAEMCRYDPEVANRAFDYASGVQDQREHIRFVSRAAALMGVGPEQPLSADQHARIDSCGSSLAASLPTLAPDLPLPPELANHTARLESVLTSAADRLLAEPDNPVLVGTGDAVAAAVFDAASVSERRLRALAVPSAAPLPPLQAPARPPAAFPPSGPAISPLSAQVVDSMGSELDDRLARGVGPGAGRLQQYLGDMVDVARASGLAVNVVEGVPSGPLEVRSDKSLAELGSDPLDHGRALVAGVRSVAEGLVARDERFNSGTGEGPLASTALAADLLVHAAVTHGCERDAPLSIHSNIDVTSSVEQFRNAFGEVCKQAERGDSAAGEPADGYSAAAKTVVGRCLEQSRVSSPAGIDWVLENAQRIGQEFAKAGIHVSLARNPSSTVGRFPDGRLVPPAPLTPGSPPDRDSLVSDPGVSGADRPVRVEPPESRVRGRGDRNRA